MNEKQLRLVELCARPAKKDVINYFMFIQSWMNKHEGNCVNYDLSYNIDPFSHYDVMQIKQDPEDPSDMEIQYVELKGRNVTIDRYNDCVVDELKIKALQNLARKTYKKVFLCALYYESSRLAIWEIDPDKTYPTEKKKCNRMTVVSTAMKDDKTVVALPLNQAYIYPFTPVSVDEGLKHTKNI